MAEEIDEDIAAMDNDTREGNTGTENEKAHVSKEESVAKKREDKVIAEPTIAKEANAGNVAIEDVKVTDMDEENDVITEIVAKIAAVREKRAAIRAENKKDREAFDDKVERVADGHRKWTLYDCESCDFMTTNVNKVRSHSRNNAW